MYKKDVLLNFTPYQPSRKRGNKRLLIYYQKYKRTKAKTYYYHFLQAYCSVSVIHNFQTLQNWRVTYILYSATVSWTEINCGGWDLHPRFPPYEGGEMTRLLYPAIYKPSLYPPARMDFVRTTPYLTLQSIKRDII